MTAQSIFAIIKSCLFPPPPPLGTCSECKCKVADNKNICLECEWWHAIR